MGFAIVAFILGMIVDRLNHNAKLKAERRHRSDIKAMFRKIRKAKKE